MRTLIVTSFLLCALAVSADAQTRTSSGAQSSAGAAHPYPGGAGIAGGVTAGGSSGANLKADLTPSTPTVAGAPQVDPSLQSKPQDSVPTAPVQVIPPPEPLEEPPPSDSGESDGLPPSIAVPDEPTPKREIPGWWLLVAVAIGGLIWVSRDEKK